MLIADIETEFHEIIIHKYLLGYYMNGRILHEPFERLIFVVLKLSTTTFNLPESAKIYPICRFAFPTPKLTFMVSSCLIEQNPI